MRLCVVVVAASLLIGCGPSRAKLYPVSGKVTFQGKPVAAGMIRFSNPQAGIDMLARIGDGGYDVVMDRGRGLPAGSYRVAVMPPLAPQQFGPIKAHQRRECADIPERYRRPSSSGLALTVQPGLGSFDVDMQP